MRFVTFEMGNEQRIGLLLADNQVLDLQKAQELMENQITLPNTMIGLIQLGESAINKSKEILEWIQIGNGEAASYSLTKDVRLLAPIPRPTKNIFCLGKK